MGNVALIGGGRWARVHASILERLDIPQVVLCSPSNPAAWQTLPHGWQQADMAQVLQDRAISHVVIARKARDHAQTAMLCLAAGKQVLVEKPFALTRADAAAVVDLAKGCACHTGLVFAYAPYLQAFHAACLPFGPVADMEILWADPHVETRYGEQKRHDPSMNVVQDVLPHVWSWMRPYVQSDLRLGEVSIDAGGQYVTLNMHAEGQRISVVLQRGGAARMRRMRLRGASLMAEIDFAIEPGIAMVNDRPLDLSGYGASPMQAQISAFLAGNLAPFTQVAMAREAIDLSVSAIEKIRPLQAEIIRQNLHQPTDHSRAALAEVALGGVWGAGDGADFDTVAAWLGISSHDIDALALAWTS